MRRLALVLAIGGLVGCADLLGLGDFGDADASADAADDVRVDVVEVDASDGGDASCTSASADDATGIFVATSGSTDSSTCGTKTVPCASVQTGLDRAHVIAGKSVVYVARGTYAESITLYAGIRLEGGWDVLDDGQSKSWVQTCADPPSAVVIQPATANRTVVAVDLGGTATLATLTLQSKALATSGESLYGVFATGQTTTVALDDVVIRVASGGAGAPGGVGAVGDAGATGCASGNGGSGTVGTAGSGAEAGVFDLAGWEPSGGVAGEVGTVASAGAAGGAGACVACGTCKFTLGCSFNTNGTSSCGSVGFAGCGGDPGGPGSPGMGAGSSVGIFAWDATVTTQGGSIAVGNGGGGGSGGEGGHGGAGGAGAPGDAGASCGVSCGGGCNAVSGAGAGGDAGTAGGSGGAGGAGGGGAGGCAYAIYQGGDAGVSATGTPLSHGDAGAGGGPDGSAGASGASADRFP